MAYPAHCPRRTTVSARRIILPDLARLPAFSHAVVAGDFVFVSGTLGTLANSTELAPGGTGPETTQALRNIERILARCGASWGDVVKLSVFLRDMATAREMNAAYLEVIGRDGPARITVGRAELALEAAVEIDCIAYRAAR